LISRKIINVDFKAFARTKLGSANEVVPEVEIIVEEGRAEEKQKQLYDEEPNVDGWKVLGTIKNNQGYQQPPFIQEIIDVLFKYDVILYITMLAF
jgi:hypothetical protein